MKKLISSATKIVLLMIALTACIGFMIGKLEAKDFMVLAGMVLGFYFSFKGESNSEYAGK